MKHIEFRNYLAEKGIELTPCQANEALFSLDKLKARIRMNLRENKCYLTNLESLTIEERLKNIKVLKKQGMVLTLKEYNDYLKILLYVGRGEFAEEY